MRRIAESPTDPNSEGSDEWDGEEVEVVPNSISHQSSTSPSQPASRRFQIQVIPGTPEISTQSFLPFHIEFLPLPGLPWFHQWGHCPFQSPGTLLWSPPKTKNYCKLHQNKRGSISFSVSCQPSISAKRMLASPGYHRRSKYGE
ncbi:hypothetical protein O181_060079 [Austropuccinia psidii MF-1]|uniref:Uncharacterized protein n=1 Tax=Austropuccinia psidii MF-1 TaxID=1389203 RepID=A0A9Q3EFI7_9BASI|nr:hypothetical protein [Austropuccinia psidii MF-1]